MIRAVLAHAPDTEVRFIDALTVDTYFFKEHGDEHVLFVHPHHRELVDTLRNLPAAEPPD